MELLERAAALADLDRWQDEALAGTGRLVLISGEAGVGKTSLLDALATSLRAIRGPRSVLWSACDALTTPRPFGPLTDIASALGGQVEALLNAGLGLVPATSELAQSEITQSALFGRVLRALAGRAGPSLLVIEDLHWADELTLAMVSFLARRIANKPALVVATYRHEEVLPSHPLQVLLGNLANVAAVRRLQLQPLSRNAVATIVGDSGIDPDRLFATTAGNPFFVAEVLATGGKNIPPTVRDAVLARAAQLTPPARLVLEAAAVVTPPLETWLLAEVADCALQLIDECVAAGMLQARPERLEFRHELARMAVEDSVAPGRRLQLHQRTVTALMARPETAQDHARLVHHAEGAGDAVAVLAHAVPAGARAAALGAHRVAAAQYARASQLTARLPARDAAELLQQHAYECYLTNHLDDAAASQTKALTHWSDMGDRLREGDALRRLSRIAWFQGDRATAERHGQAAVTLLQDHAPDSPEMAMAYSNLAQLAMLAHDLPLTVHWGQLASGLAERVGRADILSHALNNVGTAEALTDPKAGWAKLLRSLALAKASNLEEHVARALTNLATTAVSIRRFAEADAWLDQGIDYCSERELDSWLMYLLAWRARSNMDQGRWSSAEKDADEVLSSCDGPAMTRVVALAVKALILARRGQNGAFPLLEEASALADATGETQRTLPVAVAWAEAAWLIGQPAKGLAAVERTLPSLERDDRHGWGIAELTYWHRRLIVAADPQRKILQGSMDRHTARDVRRHVPFALQTTGDWAGAASRWEGLGCPYEAACARAESGSDSDLRAALTALLQLGARPAAAAVSQRLRDMGATGISRGPNSTTRTGPSNLTRREVEVLDLVAEGLRNAEIARRLFISAKTVEHHMSAILAKLGVSTRLEAARTRAISHRNGGSRQTA